MKRKFRNFILWSTTFLVALPTLTISSLIMAPKARAAVGHIVISEIQTAGAAATDEFIELYNPTASLIDLSALPLKLHIINSAGTDQNKTLTFVNNSIPAYGFFLIASQSGYTGAVTADTTYSTASGNTLVSNGSVYISTSSVNDTGIIDKVGWGSSGVSETAPFATNPSANGSMERKPGADTPTQGNGVDTDNNANDFAIRATSEPQNSSSPIEQPTVLSISSISVTPNPAKSGSDLTIAFTVSLALITDLTVTVGGNAATFVSKNGLVYTYNYTVVGTETTGANTIAISVTDTDGNTVTDTSKSVTFDFTPPLIPDAAKITLAQNATGSNDTVTGATGAVENNATVKIYSDNGLTNLIISGTAGVTGDFGALSIGDNANADIYLVAIDAAGNISPALHLINDIAAPTNGSVSINSGALISNSNTVSLTLSATGATKMKFSLDNSHWSSPVTYNTSLPSADLSDSSLGGNSGDGNKTIYVQFLDDAGNISPTASAVINVNSKVENTKVANIVSGLQTITPTDDIVLNITATGNTLLTKATYSSNPETMLESGLTPLIGKYLELAISDTSKIVWPIEIKVYFTQDELAKAGVSSTSQIIGLYFWDSANSKWKLYDGDHGSTGVTTPADKENYLGYVWAKVNHFTPMLIGLDLVAPSTISELTALAGDGQVSLSWEKIDDAVGYYIRYREAGTESFTLVYLPGVDSISTKITDLINGKNYEFGVAAIDQAGNIASYISVNAAPQPLAPIAITPLPSMPKSAPAVGGYHPLPRVEIIPKAKAAEPKKEEIVVEEVGKVKAEEAVAVRNWVRALVSLAVLIIITGGGLAAYAAYEWWTERETSGKKNKTKNNKPKKKEKKSKSPARW